MENYKENLKVLVRSSLFLTLFMISGCFFKITDIPDQSFNYSNETAIVFGRLEILKHGQPVPHNTTHRFGSYIFVDPILDENKFWVIADQVFSHRTSGEFSKISAFYKYRIRITRPDGYFMAVLPHGKYVIKATQIYDGRYVSDQTPYLVTFDIIPQKATYIGTIQVIENKKIYYKLKDNIVQETVDRLAYGPMLPVFMPPDTTRKLITQEEYMKLNSHEQSKYEKSDNNVLDSWQINNEFEEAKKIFTSLYPDHSELIERLGEIKTDSTK